jgi:predicted ATP-binding protein involved in virulence
MKIDQLNLTQMRAYEQAEFHFQSGMNLIVGINGVGKSTVLDALRLMLMRTLPRLTGIKIRPENFESTDITNDRSALTIELQLDNMGYMLNHLIYQPRKQIIDMSEEGAVREQVLEPKERDDLSYFDEKGRLQPIESPKDIPMHIRSDMGQPLAVYFSTRRSLSSEAQGTPSERSAGGSALALADSLRSRELRIREFTNWWRVQEEIGTPERIEALKQAVIRFLDGFTNVQVIRDPEPTLKLYKRDTALTARQLSDGERGILTLVLDLARRLSLANPKLRDPLRDGKAIVLIDELDLHLHPRWQRTIVQKLTETFPACQFIATTHSPQIIGEVPPENIILLEYGKQPYRPDQSLGMDTNWILQILMDTADRNEETTSRLEHISDLIEDGEYEEASQAIEQLREKIPSDPELARLQVRLDRLQILGE